MRRLLTLALLVALGCDTGNNNGSGVNMPEVDCNSNMYFSGRTYETRCGDVIQVKARYLIGDNPPMVTTERAGRGETVIVMTEEEARRLLKVLEFQLSGQ